MTPSFGEPDNVLLASFSKSHLNYHRDIEYIRTDTFIEKACDVYCNTCDKSRRCSGIGCAKLSTFKEQLKNRL